MASPQEYRLYTFVANMYLSSLQKGLQTSHVVGELSQYKTGTRQKEAFDTWAQDDKTVIICAALNHGGVLDCYAELERINTALDLPCALFREDEVSMNCMATACGVVVPKEYHDVEWIAVTSEDGYWEHVSEDGKGTRYFLTHPEGQFISHIKKYRLA